MQDSRDRLVRWLIVPILAASLPAVAAEDPEPSAQVTIGSRRSVWQIRLDDGSTFLTHGPDRVVGVDSLAHDLAGRLPRGADKRSISCVGSGSPHFRAIYARARDDVDRSALMVPLLRQAIYDASGFMDSEAGRASPGARARLNMLCDGNGEVAVDVAVLGIDAEDAQASTIIAALQAIGYADGRAKYLVFYDDCVELCMVGGQGTIRQDDSASASNANNSGLSYAIDYADLLIDGPAWATILHEASHNMGAVQLSAPHTSGAFHCNDGVDIMCYDDGGPSSDYREQTCLNLSFDCLNDDYFSPAPAPGSYLSDHWNIAAAYNSYIDHD